MRVLQTILSVAALAGGAFPATGMVRTGVLLRPVPETAGLSNAAQGEPDVRELVPGASIGRELAGGQVHTYRIALTSGQYLHIIAETDDIEARLILFGPGGQKVTESYSPNGNRGPENILFIPEEAGSFRLEVRTTKTNAAPGRYELKIAEIRTATTEDRSRVAARRLFEEGQHLRTQPNAESLRQAIEKYEKSLPHWKVAKDVRMEAITLNNIGLVYSFLSEQQKSLDYYLQSLDLRRVAGDRLGIATSLSNIGFVYYEMGDAQRALDYTNQALTLWREMQSREREAVGLLNIGAAYSLLGEYRQAVDYFRQAMSLFREQADRAFALNNIGAAYIRLGELQKALEHLNQALAIYQESGNRRGEGEALNNIGRVYSDLGEKQKAFDYYSRALQLRRAIEDQRGEAASLFGIARVERDRGQLINSHARMEAAIEIIESLRTKVASQELRASFSASVQDYYKLDIDLLMQLHEQSPSEGHDAAALQASERARARSLLETLIEARVDIRQGVDPVLLERERALLQQLNAKAEFHTRLLSGKHTEEHATAVKKEIDTLSTQYQEVQAQIRENSPRYAALTQPSPIRLREIQQQVLDEDTLLLEYSLGYDHSYLWAVTPTSIISYKLPKQSEIETAARRVYDLLIVSHHRASKRQAELEAAELSRMVLGPVAAQLGNKRLLIVADGALQYVPFGALPLPESRRQGDKGNSQSAIRNPQSFTPLIVSHEIVSLPSASTLALLRRELAGRPSASKPVAVLADPVLLPDDVRVKQVAAQAGKETSGPTPASGDTRGVADNLVRSAKEAGVISWERLPFTREEAEVIAQLAQQQSLKALDFAASRATATNPELSQYRVVHLATHGLLNSQHPELSGIVLSLVDERGQPQNGFLRLHDIYNLRLNADLVVLSACQTALGKEVKGEGLVGLTRGFMYAGAARMVASLWNVRDQATAELMKRFYQGMLKEGLRPAAALRVAQVSMWKEGRWEAPYYWAGFVLQGEWK